MLPAVIREARRRRFPLGLVVPGDKGVPTGTDFELLQSLCPANWGMHGTLEESGRLRIRGGFGLFYNPIEQLVLEQFRPSLPSAAALRSSEDLFNTPFVSQSGGTLRPIPFNGVLTPPRGYPYGLVCLPSHLLVRRTRAAFACAIYGAIQLRHQREITRDMVLSMGYVGSQGHRLLATRDINYGNAQTCLDLQYIADLHRRWQIWRAVRTTLTVRSLLRPARFLPGNPALAIWSQATVTGSESHAPLRLSDLRQVFFTELRSVYRERLPFRWRPGIFQHLRAGYRLLIRITTLCRLRWKRASRMDCSSRWLTP